MSARTPICQRALASSLIAAGLVTGALRPADGGFPDDVAFQRMLDELERSWATVAVADQPVLDARPAPPAEPDHAPAEPATDTDARIEELQQAIAERDAVIADLRQRLGRLESWWQAMAAADPSPPLEVEARPIPAALPAVAPAAPNGAPPVPSGRPGVETAAFAPSQFEITQEVIDRALERALTQTGALLLPPGTVEIDSGFSFVRREDAVPVLVANGDQAIVAIDEVRRNEFETGLTAKLGLPLETQLEVKVPYRYKGSSNVAKVGFAEQGRADRQGSGFGDISVGLAKGLMREQGWRPDLIGRIRWDSNTGGSDGGLALGNGFHGFTGSLTAVKRQDPLVFVGTASYGRTLENDGINPGDEFGFSVGTVLAANPQTSLRFFLAQSFVGELEVDGRAIGGSNQVSTSLVLGASSVILPRMLLDVSVGIGLTEDAPDYSIAVSLPIRFSLPPLF